ncbi:hypothetical protein ACO0M4_06625 [Streptomyces sp. RGM 3693]|uniref:hypothetical protein n=1 Tax=Streptomyces sp. RGM 3693 TaxID=3413284 RepID=UPI003D2852EE
MAALHHPLPARPPAAPKAASAPGAPRTGRAVAGRRTASGGRAVGAVPPADELGRDLALPVGAAATAVAVTALLVTGQAGHLWLSLAAFALLTVAIAAAARPRLVPAVVLVSWMFFDGFVVHQRAELAWQQTDRTSLWILAGAGLAGAVCAAAVRGARAARTRRGGAG